MNKKKVMVTSLTALTLLSTGAITTYVANNVVVEAEGNQNITVRKTIWLVDGIQKNEASGDHKESEFKVSSNAKLNKTDITEYGYKMFYYVTNSTD